jgi:translation initiation factor IF-1
VSKEDLIVTQGSIEEALPNAMFRVRISENHQIVAVISGRLRKNRIQILVGDNVRIELSPYDLTRGRITYREK